MLLTHVRGPTSFDALCTVNGVAHHTFQSACLALGLLGNDEEWRHCLDQAANFQTGTQLQSLFVLPLLHCEPANPLGLWERYKVQICDDLPRILQTRHHVHAPTEDQVVDYGLFLICQSQPILCCLRVEDQSHSFCVLALTFQISNFLCLWEIGLQYSTITT